MHLMFNGSNEVRLMSNEFTTVITFMTFPEFFHYVRMQLQTQESAAHHSAISSNVACVRDHLY